jgi:hypothetical protein
MVKNEKIEKQKQKEREKEEKLAEEHKQIITVEQVGTAPKSTAELFAQTKKDLEIKEIAEKRRKKAKTGAISVKTERMFKGWRRNRTPQESTAIGKTLRVGMKKLTQLASLV